METCAAFFSIEFIQYRKTHNFNYLVHIDHCRFNTEGKGWNRVCRTVLGLLLKKPWYNIGQSWMLLSYFAQDRFLENVWISERRQKITQYKLIIHEHMHWLPELSTNICLTTDRTCTQEYSSFIVNQTTWLCSNEDLMHNKLRVLPIKNNLKKEATHTSNAQKKQLIY